MHYMPLHAEQDDDVIMDGLTVPLAVLPARQRYASEKLAARRTGAASAARPWTRTVTRKVVNAGPVRRGPRPRRASPSDIISY